MAVRVRDFVRAHSGGDAGIAKVLARLEERLARTEALAIQEQDGRREQHAATVRRRELRQRMQDQLLPSLVQVGMRVGREVPGLLEGFRTPASTGPHQTFLTTTKAMLAAAVAEKARFIEQGLAEAVFDQLGQAVTEFEEATERSHKGRRAHVGAGADLKAVTEEIGGLVDLLNALVRVPFGDDPELMAAWESARNIVGPFRSRKQESGSEGGEAPPSGGVAPAA